MEEKVIKAYKGFDQDLKCRGFQYEVGKEYEMSGDICCCEKGFHACESPLEVLDHYFLLDGVKMARFCEVEQSGTLSRKNNTITKVASSKIRIKAELKFGDLIKAGVEWLKEKTSPTNIQTEGGLNDNGKREKQIGSSGNYAKIGSSGNYAKIGSSGDYAQIGSSGDYAQIGSSGDSAQIGSSGNSAKIGSSGDYAQIGSSGYYAQIGSSGDSAQIGSSGYYAQIGSSGDSAKIGSSGDYAKIGSSGDYAKIESTGEDSVICCAGHNSAVKAKQGSWITLSEWVRNEEKNRWVPRCVKTEYVDGERIKADTWYKLVDGEFKEVEVLLWQQFYD
jgi:hypothetical protein